MASKYKTTGCFKFLIFLLFFVPIAYFGASYYHGVDGIQQIKEIIGMETSEGDQTEKAEKAKSETYNMDAQEKIKELENKIKDLEAELYRKNQEIQDLQSMRDN